MSLANLQFQCRRLVRGQCQLVACHHMAGRQQAFTVFQTIGYVKQRLITFAEVSQWQGQLHRLLGSDFQVLYPASADHTPGFQHFPLHIIGRKVTEEVLVVDADFHIVILQLVGQSGPDALVDTSHLVHVRVRYAVGADKAVVAEVHVTGIKTVEVASIGINHRTVLACPAYRLVYKVPDKSALIPGILAHQVPIFLETTFRITHGVCILTLNQRFVGRSVFAVTAAIVITQVHGAINIGFARPSGLLVLHGTAGVLGLHPVIGCLEVGAVTGLVA